MLSERLIQDINIRGNKRLAGKDFELLEKTVREINPLNIVEIGCMDGTSSMLFGSIAKEYNGKVTSIEPSPRQRWYNNIKALNLENTVTLYKYASPWVPMDIIPKPIDYLFIDGKHQSRWAIVDYHFFFHFVRIGGRIAFHDYNANQKVGTWVRRAIDIILEDDSEKLKEVGRNKTSNRGTIVFEKIGD